MEIGLNATPKPEDAWFWKDLGITWAKWSADIDGDTVQDDRARLEYAASLGLRVCVDLRTSTQFLTRITLDVQEQMADAGLLESLPHGGEPHEQERVIRANQAATHGGVLERIGEAARRYVERHKDLVQDYEWWGEYDCPITSQGIFHIICYPATLKAVYAAIKAEQPAARVWTGGNGMDLSDGWVVGLRQDKALKSFDVMNWHPYPMSLRKRSTIEERLEDNYTGWRKILDAEGLGQPFASTEWGYPSLKSITAKQRQWLTSQVVEAGISQLYPEEAVEAYTGDLQIMERHGFEVVMVHTLRDGKTRFWGEKCGLLTVPLPGLKGRALRRLWRTVEAKPVYGLVREWGHRGKAGRPAFEKE